MTIGKLSVLVAIFAAFAFPTGALADHGSGGGDSGSGSGDQSQTVATTGGDDQAGDDNGAAEQNEPGDDNDAADEQNEPEDNATSSSAVTPSSTPASGRTEKFELRGTVISVDPSTDQVVLKVTKTNHGRRGRTLAGQTLTFDLTNARLDVRDTNADGVRDLNDVAAGDFAEVRAQLSRPLPGSFSGPVMAQRFKDRSRRHQADQPAGAH